MTEITYREALRTALDEEILRDEKVVIIGEEVAQYNGAYKVTEGLWKKHGDRRVVDTPISEAGFIGMGIGAATLGLRPVMELMFWSFAYVAFDQIINNAGCIRYMSGGLVNLPIVIRGPARRYAVAIGFGQGGGSSVSPALLPPRRTGRYSRLIALVILWILAHEH